MYTATSALATYSVDRCTNRMAKLYEDGYRSFKVEICKRYTPSEYRSSGHVETFVRTTDQKLGTRFFYSCNASEPSSVAICVTDTDFHRIEKILGIRG